MFKKSRLIIFMFLIILMFASLFAGMVNIQVYNGEMFRDLGLKLSSSEFVQSAVRGEILDRKGNALVKNRLCLSVEIKDCSDEVLKKLCNIANKDYKDVKNTMDEGGVLRSHPFIFARDIGSKAASIIEEKGFDGVRIISEYVRDYEEDVRASHILGRVGAISGEEYNELKSKGYSINSQIGKDGIEALMESELKGADGLKLIKNGEILEYKKEKDGNKVYLTIDKQLQTEAEKALKASVEKSGKTGGGALVVLDIKSGEVLAMASYPDFNTETFAKDYEKLLSDELNPLLNRCISGVYEPGSTFKPAVALAGLNEKVITSEEKIVDEGVYTYYAPTYTPSCHIWTREHRTHGEVDLSKAISESCNYYFYEAGRRLTIDNIVKYAKKFGLGEKTGIELHGESSGTLASRESKQEWYSGDTLQAAIGQSVNMFTPLQLASYISAVASNGKRAQPHIIKSVETTEGEIVFESAVKTSEASETRMDSYTAVREGMLECTKSGTASESFKNITFNVGGKTGTAQVPKGEDNGLFVGFAPFEAPEIAVAVVIEHGSGTYPADAAADVMKKYVDLKGEL